MTAEVTIRSTQRDAVRVAAAGAAGICLAFAGMQVALAAGAPLGEHVWLVTRRWTPGTTEWTDSVPIRHGMWSVGGLPAADHISGREQETAADLHVYLGRVGEI